MNFNLYAKGILLHIKQPDLGPRWLKEATEIKADDFCCEWWNEISMPTANL